MTRATPKHGSAGTPSPARGDRSKPNSLASLLACVCFGSGSPRGKRTERARTRQAAREAPTQSATPRREERSPGEAQQAPGPTRAESTESSELGHEIERRWAGSASVRGSEQKQAEARTVFSAVTAKPEASPVASPYGEVPRGPGQASTRPAVSSVDEATQTVGKEGAGEIVAPSPQAVAGEGGVGAGAGVTGTPASPAAAAGAASSPETARRVQKASEEAHASNDACAPDAIHLTMAPAGSQHTGAAAVKPQVSPHVGVPAAAEVEKGAAAREGGAGASVEVGDAAVPSKAQDDADRDLPEPSALLSSEAKDEVREDLPVSTPAAPGNEASPLKAGSFRGATSRRSTGGSIVMDRDRDSGQASPSSPLPRSLLSLHPLRDLDRPPRRSSRRSSGVSPKDTPVRTSPGLSPKDTPGQASSSVAVATDESAVLKGVGVGDIHRVVPVEWEMAAECVESHAGAEPTTAGEGVTTTGAERHSVGAEMATAGAEPATAEQLAASATSASPAPRDGDSGVETEATGADGLATGTGTDDGTKEGRPSGLSMADGVGGSDFEAAYEGEPLSDLEGPLLALLGKMYGRPVTAASQLPLLPCPPWRKGEGGYLDFLTKDQREALRKMREMHLVSYRIHTDHDMLRFLRAREFNLPAASAMYANYLQLYLPSLQLSPQPPIRPIVNHDITFLQDIPPRGERVSRRLQAVFDHFLEVAVVGADRSGRPIVWNRLKETIDRQYGTRTSVLDRLLLQAASQEALRLVCHQQSCKHGFNIEEVVIVIDMNGMSLIGLHRHLTHPAIKQETNLSLDYFPETLSRVHIINAPFGTQPIWNVVKFILPPKTRGKFNILGHNYKGELCRALGQENVPRCYGGTLDWEWRPLRPLSEWGAVSARELPLEDDEDIVKVQKSPDAELRRGAGRAASLEARGGGQEAATVQHSSAEGSMAGASPPKEGKDGGVGEGEGRGDVEGQGGSGGEVEREGQGGLDGERKAEESPIRDAKRARRELQLGESRVEREVGAAGIGQGSGLGGLGGSVNVGESREATGREMGVQSDAGSVLTGQQGIVHVGVSGQIGAGSQEHGMGSNGVQGDLSAVGRDEGGDGAAVLAGHVAEGNGAAEGVERGGRVASASVGGGEGAVSAPSSPSSPLHGVASVSQEGPGSEGVRGGQEKVLAAGTEAVLMAEEGAGGAVIALANAGALAVDTPVPGMLQSVPGATGPDASASLQAHTVAVSDATSSGPSDLGASRGALADALPGAQAGNHVTSNGAMPMPRSESEITVGPELQLLPQSGSEAAMTGTGSVPQSGSETRLADAEPFTAEISFRLDRGSSETSASAAAVDTRPPALGMPALAIARTEDTGPRLGVAEGAGQSGATVDVDGGSRGAGETGVTEPAGVGRDGGHGGDEGGSVSPAPPPEVGTPGGSPAEARAEVPAPESDTDSSEMTESEDDSDSDVGLTEADVQLVTGMATPVKAEAPLDGNGVDHGDGAATPATPQSTRARQLTSTPSLRRGFTGELRSFTLRSRTSPGLLKRSPSSGSRSQASLDGSPVPESVRGVHALHRHATVGGERLAALMDAAAEEGGDADAAQRAAKRPKQDAD